MLNRDADVIDTTAERLIEVGGTYYPESELKAAIEARESPRWYIGAGLQIIGFWTLIFGVGALLFG